jgi:hypothetical protein
LGVCVASFTKESYGERCLKALSCKSGLSSRSAQGGEAAPLSGLIKLDLSDNTQLTVDGVRTLAVTLSRMNNRVAYLGLRRNRLVCAPVENGPYWTPIEYRTKRNP